MPELVQKCIKTQKIPGYEHRLITLENCYRGSRYVRECLDAKNWVKASDWIRIWNIYSEGGIYVDGDMEILNGKNFDHLLGHRMFLSKEAAGLWANAALGSEPGHEVLKRYLDRVENNFRGQGDDVFSPGIRCFTDVFWEVLRDWERSEKRWAASPDKLKAHGIHECPVEWFFPFNHMTDQITIVPETIVYHHYMRSWKLCHDPEVPPQTDFRFYCNYHLGDQIFTLWFLQNAAKLWPDLHFSLFVEPTYFEQVRELAVKLKNLEITNVFNNHTQLEWWAGHWAVARRNPDSEHFVDSMMKLQGHLAMKYGMPGWPQLSKFDMLLEKECMSSDHPLRDESFDILYVNSSPLSGQCPNYNPDRVNRIARTLVERGFKVVTTHPCGLDVPCTSQLGLRLCHIGELASRCGMVAGVANAPFISTFNKLAWDRVGNWVNFGTDVLNFNDRVIGTPTMELFEECMLSWVKRAA